MSNRSVNQRDCRCGCGKMTIAKCYECGVSLQDEDIAFYKKKIYCRQCVKMVRRRGA